MPDYSGYQIALIAILVLNLVFWSLVVCIRLFFDCTCSEFTLCCLEARAPVVRRRRRRGTQLPPRSRNQSANQLMGIRNPAFSNLDEGFESNPYNIVGALEPPPSYEDALQYSPCNNVHQSLQQNIHSSSNAPGRQLNSYEVPVVLSVPEERTSVSEVRLQTSMNDGHNHQATEHACLRSLNHTDDDNTVTTSTRVITFHNDRNNADSSPIMVEDDNASLTFIIDCIGAQSMKIMKMKEISTTLSDGEQLMTYSNV